MGFVIKYLILKDTKNANQINKSKGFINHQISKIK